MLVLLYQKVNPQEIPIESKGGRPRRRRRAPNSTRPSRPRCFFRLDPGAVFLLGHPWEKHAKPEGKPVENHGKTMGKPWENPWENDDFMGKPRKKWSFQGCCSESDES